MDFTRPWKHGDIIFVVEEGKVYANKAVLSMVSPAMNAMFTHEFKVKINM